MLKEIERRRIILIEDDIQIRQSFKVIINSSTKFKVVGDFGSCEEALPKLKKLRPGIVLMDIALEGMNGIDGTAAVKAQYPGIEIIMVTIHEDSELVFNALKAGASGYILKSSNYVELLKALDEIVNGGAPMSSQIARMVVNDFHLNFVNPLTKKETAVLKCLASGRTYTQIADELAVSKETVKTHIRNIYKKLGINKKSEAIAFGTSEKII